MNEDYYSNDTIMEVLENNNFFVILPWYPNEIIKIPAIVDIRLIMLILNNK